MFQIDILTVYLVRIDFTVRQINANANMAMFRNQITPITSSKNQVEDYNHYFSKICNEIRFSVVVLYFFSSIMIKI